MPCVSTHAHCDRGTHVIILHSSPSPLSNLSQSLLVLLTDDNYHLVKSIILNIGDPDVSYSYYYVSLSFTRQYCGDHLSQAAYILARRPRVMVRAGGRTVSY